MKKKPAEDPKPPELGPDLGYVPADNRGLTTRQYFREHKPRYQGKIQRATDAAYLNSLDSIMGKGNPHFPPLTEQERETITKYGKHVRQTQRGLQNKPKADKGNLKRGQAKFERVRRLEADHDRKGTPDHTRAAKIARHMNVETPSDPTSIDHVRRLRRRLLSK